MQWVVVVAAAAVVVTKGLILDELPKTVLDGGIKMN